jgi:hypothetical protein
MNTSSRQVSVPEHLCSAAEKRFGELEAFLSFVLTELVRDEALVLDQNDTRIVEDRLRDLGYL